jgi:UDP-3-O-[3-hydroxymyristoyl] glucosamine N-acyltransferase
MVSAGEIAAEGSLGIVKVVGDPARPASRAAALSDAGTGSLTFCGPRIDAAALAARSAALAGSLVICDPAKAQADGLSELTLLISDNPRLSFMRAVRIFFPPALPPPGVHPTASVDSSAAIDPSASIGAYCVVGAGCSIGAGSILHPHVTLYPGVVVGRGVNINAGTVIGADGFGYERNETGDLEKFPHIGGVVIEDEVEIGSNTSIDRGSLGDTRICRGARIDNQIHIAHNVVVGENAAVIAQSMVGGSVSIGANAWLAPAAVVMNQVSIGSDAVVGLGAVVTKDVANGQTVMGAPAQDEAAFKAARAALKRLVDG